MTDEEFRDRRRELWLKRAELRLEKETLEFDRAETKRARGLNSLATPLGVAVVAGVLALFGNAAAGAFGLVSDWRQHQSDLIVKISEVQDETQRSLNMLFFAEGGYLKLSQEYRDYLRDKAGLNKDDIVPRRGCRRRSSYQSLIP